VAVSGALRKGIMRERAHYFHFSAENAKIADWMADGTVRCELLSGRIPCLAGNLLGIFRF
jgi:hypothetical protein